jgi:hypothetical protein
MELVKFNKDDVCICGTKLRKGTGSNKIYKKGCLVRIISHKIGRTSVSYRVWNIDFQRYEEIGEIYLKLDLQTTRERYLKKIFKDE